MVTEKKKIKCPSCNIPLDEYSNIYGTWYQCGECDYETEQE